MGTHVEEKVWCNVQRIERIERSFRKPAARLRDTFVQLADSGYGDVYTGWRSIGLPLSLLPNSVAACSLFKLVGIGKYTVFGL